jgi:protein-tyrosine phosphatase
VIDLHSHLLPAVDDGSRSVEQSVKVLRALDRLGLTDICLTPHLRAGEAGQGPPERHERAYQALLAEVPAMPRLHRGAEIMLDRPLAGPPATIRRVTLGGSRYILVEFPRLVTLDTVTIALGRVGELDLVPVLAHPERYSCCTPDAVARWRELGARMQVDATTLLSPQPRGQRARALLRYGLADILAGDNHGDDRSVAAGADFLHTQNGGEQAELLTVQNPGAILQDAPLLPVPPIQIRSSWMQRIRELLEGSR